MSRRQYSNIPVITEWASFTPTGTWNTSTTFVGYWRRVADCLEVTGTVSVTGAPASVTLTVNLPLGLVIDVNKIIEEFSTDTVGASVGTSIVRDVSTDVNHCGVVAYTTTTTLAIQTFLVSGTFISKQSISQAAPMTWANGDALHYTYSVPIVGWSATRKGR